jgi:hypothetical protein
MASEINTVAGIDTVRTIEIVTQEVRNYANDVSRVFPVVKAYLWRKIDVLTDISLLTRDYFWLGIEPHAIKASYLVDDHPFVREILRTGIEI